MSDKKQYVFNIGPYLRGRSYRAWAIDAGVPHATLSEWKNGNFTPANPRLFEVAEALGVLVSDLFNEAGEFDIRLAPGNISTAEAARRSGVAYNTIQQWQSGRRKPLSAGLLALAETMGITIEQAFGIGEPTGV